MADDTNTAQENTDNAATGDVQAAAGSVLTDAKSATGETAQAATDQQTDGATAEDKQTDEDAKPEGAPEQYEFKAPEGAELDTEAVAAFEPIAKELNLTNEQAQKLVDLYGTRLTQQVEAQQQAWQKQLDTWVSEVKSDKEIGGKAFDQNVDHAKAALTKFGTPELKQALDATGFGNHPELVRVFARIGKTMAEDNFVQANAAAGGKKTAAEIFYPGSQSNGQ